MKIKSAENINFDGFSNENTIIIWDNNETRIELIQKQCHLLKVNLFLAEQFEDIVAIPSFLSIINPSMLSETEWNTLGNFLAEIDDNSYKFLLTDSSEQQQIPRNNLITTPESLTENFIKFLILKTRSTYKRRRGIWEKTERRIVRLIYILRILDSGKSFKTADIAKEFSISKRTVQRDIEVLEMGGFPIFNNKRGKYWLPEGFRVYEFYYEPED